MLAQYTSSPLYPGNPYIEALPPMMVGRELASALAFLPPYSPSDRERPAGERLQLLSQLYSIYQPLPMTIELYCQIYNTMLHSYSTYTPITEAVYAHAAYASIRSGANAASIGGGSSFSLIGVSGLGKSTALQRVLSLFPQDIEHKSYQGKMLCCHQIPYLVVQTPHDASVKALILDIYLQIDALLGTSYHVHAEKTRATTDVLVSQLSLILRSNHVGLLVVDELQNIAYRKGNGGSKFLNFLVQLINSAGIGICMVGTPRVFQLLQQEFRSARRATGLVYDRLPDGADKITAVHVSRPRSCAEKREVCPLHNNEPGLLAFWTEKMPFITLHVDMRVFFGFLTNVGDGNQTAFRIVVSVFVF